MNHKPIFITITRQMGSGGELIGKQIAKNMGIRYLDRVIVIKAARELNVLEADLESQDEKIRSFWDSFLRSLATHPLGMLYVPSEINLPSEYELYKTESKIIEKLAGKHSAVIVGRCGSYLLRDNPRHFSVFLHASPAIRQQRIEETYGLSAAESRKMIKKSDRERGDYRRMHTGQHWLDTSQYHLAIDTGVIDFKQAKEMILACVQHLQGNTDT